MQHCLESTEINQIVGDNISSSLETKKRELEKIIEYRTKGSILRAKCRWFNEDEKNTKYFFKFRKKAP